MKNVSLITGASSGIGKEMALIHAAKGGDLIIVARNREKLEELKKEIEDKYSVSVFVIAKDLSLPNAGREIYSKVKEAGIEIDYLINNAGFGGIGKFYEREWGKDLAMINLNIIALTELTRMFLPDFVKRNKGKILNTSSTASLIPGPLQAVYFATKAYVTSFSNALAEELYDTNVTVTALLPGATKTEFGKISGMDKTKMFKKTASARTVAQAGYDAMMIGKLNIISGITFSQKILFLLIPFLPKKMLLKQIRIMQEIK
jgi:short-subunit dehydrogenase